MLKMLSKLGKYWWLVVLLVITSIINAICDCRIPTYLGVIIAEIQGTGDTGIIGLNALYMVVFALLSGIAALASAKLASVITARTVAIARYDLYKRVGEFSTIEMNKFSVTSLVTRTTNDLTMVSTTLNNTFRFAFYGPLIAIVALVFLFVQGTWQFIVAIVAAIVLLIAFLIVVVKIAIPKFDSLQDKLDRVSTITRENLEGLRVVRAYNAEDYQEEKFANVNDDLMKTDRFANRALNLLMPGILMIIGVLNVMIYYISSLIIYEPGSKISFSDTTVVVEYAALILMGFVLICVVFVQLPRAMVCAKRVNEVIYTNPDIVDGSGNVNETSVGTVEFRDVTFKYPGADVPVLNHVSFKAEQGKVIAFIGATGSGKSTIINLLLRFYDPTEGEILVDGVNIKEYTLKQLFDKFGYVPQKGYLFHASLLENITLGKPGASAEQIQRALDIAQATEFVNKFPDKLQKEIAQGGKNVSGGQRQRLCIARAIIMDPEIFIFDDSFSALDYRTDKILRGEIKKQCAGVTNFIVAQRIGTIIDADQIVCLDNGNVMGIGTHKELLKKCDVYRDIALSQLSKEELENDLK